MSVTYNKECQSTLSYNMLAQMPGHIFWRNQDSHYMGCNQKTAEFHGFKNPNDIIGLTNYDFPHLESCVEQFKKIDEQVLSTKQAINCISFITSIQQHHIILYSITKPWLDKDNHLLGIICQGLELDSKLLIPASVQSLNTHPKKQRKLV